MFFNKTTSLGLQALFVMQQTDPEGYHSVTDLARQLSCSRTYLNKVLHSLVKFGYLESKTGPGAGYKFVRSPDSITLLEIVEKLNNPDYLEHCFFGLGACSDKDPCPLHFQYKKFRQDLVADMKKTSITEGARKGWKGLTQRSAKQV